MFDEEDEEDFSANIKEAFLPLHALLLNEAKM